MHANTRLIFFSALPIIAFLGLLQPPLSSPGRSASLQSDTCTQLLLAAASRAGVVGEIRNPSQYEGEGGYYNCFVGYVIPDPVHKGDGLGTNLSLIASPPGPESTACWFETSSGEWSPTSFHNYPGAAFYRTDTENYNGRSYTFEEKGLSWCMYIGGRAYILGVTTSSRWIETSGLPREPSEIAEVLLAFAEANLPLSGPLVVPPESDIPADSSPSGSNPSVDAKQSATLPSAILLGSLALPLAGAFAGAVLSALLVVRSMADTAASPLGKALDAGVDLQLLNADLNRINDELVTGKHYVLNPYQGDPTLIVQGLFKLKNLGQDYLTGTEGLTCNGYVNKTQKEVIEAVKKRFPGSTVESMIFEEKSTASVRELGNRDLAAHLGNYVNPKAWINQFDALNQDNHNLFKVTTPDGKAWAVDFHQYNAGKYKLMEPWSKVEKIWKDYMGNEFTQRSSWAQHNLR